MSNVKETRSELPGSPSGSRLNPSMITLRPERPEDAGFLAALYATTREEELNATGWDADAREQFCQMQFHCQREEYRRGFPTADFSILCHGDQSIGRIIVDRAPAELRVVDLALLPQYRGQGIGTRWMNDIMREAAQQGKPVRLHVLKWGREARWYERLGFTIIREEGFHDEMEWRVKSSGPG